MSVTIPTQLPLTLSDGSFQHILLWDIMWEPYGNIRESGGGFTITYRKMSGEAHWIREEKASDGLSIVLAPPWH